MFKRILALLLALSICIIPVYADEVEEAVTITEDAVVSAERTAAAETEDYASYAGLLSAIAPEVTEGLAEGDVTRGEFVTRLMKLLKVEPISPITHWFADVDSSSANSPYIHTAAEIGWVSKAYTFEPDAIVQLDQAYKMIVSALGYNVAAEANGGWPAGYTKMAKDMNISDGITTSGNVDDANMIILFGNILQVSYTEDKIATYNDDLAQNYLNVVHKVYETKGILNATRYNSLTYGTEVKPYGYMEVNGDIFGYDVEKEGDPIYGLLGYDVEVYYTNTEAGKNVVFTWATKANKVTRFEHSDYVGITGDELRYENENGDIKNYTLDGGCVIVYNGRILEEFMASKFDMPGYSLLLDNDGDRDIDVIHMTGYTYMQSALVDDFNGSIGDVKSSQYSLDLYNNILNSSYWLRNADGDAIALSKIPSGSVLQVAKSDDGMIVDIEILPVKSGAVEQKTSDGTYIIDGNEYKMSAYFEEFYGNIIAPGAEFTFAVGYDNMLASVTETKDTGYNYAFVLDYNVEQLFEKTLKLKVVDMSGNVVTYTTVQDKLMLDGVKNATADQVIAKLIDPATGAVKNQIIKVALNDKGEVAKIDTPVDFNNATYQRQIENGDDCLVYFPRLNKSYSYRGETNTFACVGGGTISGTGTKLLFTPPMNALTDDSKDYRCVAMNKNEFTNGMGVSSPLVYDLDVDTAAAGVAVLPNHKKKLDSATVYFIDKVYDTVDTDGETVVTGISAWKDGTWSNFKIDEDVTYSRDGSPKIQAGDLVKLRIDGSRVTELTVEFNSTTMSYNSTVASSNIEQASSETNYTIGVPYSYGNGMIRIITPNLKQGGEWKCDLDNLRGVHKYQEKYLKFNYKTKQSRPATMNEIKTIKNFGVDEADFIIVKQLYERTQMVILIEDYDNK